MKSLSDYDNLFMLSKKAKKIYIHFQNVPVLREKFKLEQNDQSFTESLSIIFSDLSYDLI
jgi:hypothetical protein